MIAVNVSTHRFPYWTPHISFSWMDKPWNNLNRLENAFFVTAFHSVLVNIVWISIIAFYLLSYEGGGGVSLR